MSYPAGKYQSKFKIVNTGFLAEFEKHLIASGKTRLTVENYVLSCRRFLKFIGGESQLAGITDDTVREFFKGIPKGAARRQTAMTVGRFLRFASRSLPAPKEPPRLPAPNDKALAVLKKRWTIDRLKQQQEEAGEVIALLGRKLIGHYLYFQSRLSGTPESMEELARMTEECGELIQAHLPLFLTLSATGRNLGVLIDERVKR